MRGMAVLKALRRLSSLVMGSRSEVRGSVYETVKGMSAGRWCDSFTSEWKSWK